ncbi:inositol-pentakisphosphate 2-kinase IPK1-like isoform X1 [Typha angustifolia]|uniref:inositol-pentakisphosphate 2-kinase IPK1-like isoform X1 n=1 Tax=Typha angustifolia TaxID=59011 RepID=UPI003C30A4ED
MQMVLRAEDAKEWVYKGEGAANLILSYCGSSSALLGKVLRVQKVPRDRTEPANTCVILSKHELLLWGEVSEIVEASSKDHLAQIFSVHVMSHYLGAKHIDGGIRVLVSTDFLEFVEINVQNHRPSCRVDATKIDTLSDSALLISDHSVFTGTPRDSVCIAVEIKPKCGFLPSSEYISKANCIKKCVTRYRMHQLLKLHHGEILKTSEYDPLDLFSRSKERIHHAIKALFSTPQNNFRVFLNGSLVFGGMGGGMDTIQSQEVDKNFEDLISVTGLQIPSFLELVGDAIFDSGVLDRLLATQNLDILDIEGAIHAYYDVVSQPCLVCKNITDIELLHQYSYLHSLPQEKKLKIAREYLIAATAKDCSLMISFRPRENGIMVSECNSVFLKSLNQIYEYKAYFIDLDMKPLEKMIYYYKLDQKIVNFYKSTSACSSTIGDNSEKKIQYPDS